jgi:hypothetical protein
LSGTAANALAFLLLTLLSLAAVGWHVHRSMRFRSYGNGRKRRITWLGAAQILFVLVVSVWFFVRSMLAWRADTIGAPASTMDWLGVLFGLAAIAAFVRVGLPTRWWHAETRAALRRRAAFRARIRELVEPEPDADADSVDMNDLILHHADAEWLEKIAAHLAAQAPPRRLSMAIAATGNPEPSEVDDVDTASSPN